MNGPDNLLPSPIEAAPLPEVINHTPWPSQYFQHVDPQGEIFHVMVTRMSYALMGMATTAELTRRAAPGKNRTTANAKSHHDAVGCQS